MRVLAALALLLVACPSTEKPEETGVPIDTAAVDSDGDGAFDKDDCLPDDATVFPGASEVCDGLDQDCDTEVDEDAIDAPVWHPDLDGDTFGDPKATLSACVVPKGYVADDTDCDDADAGSWPGAKEICDGLDQDCDGRADNGLEQTWFPDADNDGFGSPEKAISACDPGPGWVLDSTDCDDANAAAWPGAKEICDGADNDCDKQVDEELLFTYYPDSDGDTWGDGLNPIIACTQPKGSVLNADDCDDANTAVNPDATEVCNAIDDNCNGYVDDNAVDATNWYSDLDGDGYGGRFSVARSCNAIFSYVDNNEDCNDRNAAIHPEAVEVCNDTDDNCDDQVDEAAIDPLTWYVDADGDTFGDPALSSLACDAPKGSVADGADCDDASASMYPGAAETWYDGIDQDCAANDDYDADADGDAADFAGGGDCDDQDPTVWGGVGCRPQAACTHAAAKLLAAATPPNASDLVFDQSCGVYVGTISAGVDLVRRIDPDGSFQDWTAPGDQRDVGAIALDPISGGLAAGFNTVAQSVGLANGSTFDILAEGAPICGGSWGNAWLDCAPGSMAWDSQGCIWVPNFGAVGALSCVGTGGSLSVVTNLGAYVESVGLDSAENLYVSVGSAISLVDAASGAASLWATLSDTVLDMVFDWNDDCYVETLAGEIWLLPGDGSAASLFATVSGHGKLAISPDGWLVRLVPAVPTPSTWSTWEEWELGR